MNILRIGLVSVSDRASSGIYQDKGIPALEEWLTSALTTPFEVETRLIPDEQSLIEQTLCELVDEMGCHLVLTTGGTGPARRDVTPMRHWLLQIGRCQVLASKCVKLACIMCQPQFYPVR